MALWIWLHKCILHGGETWPIRKENKVALQQSEMRMVRWMCDVKVKDKVPRDRGLSGLTAEMIQATKKYWNSVVIGFM